MATSCSVSAIFPCSISLVWDKIRDFRFPATLLSSVIESVELEGTGLQIGAKRKIKWKSGEVQTHVLVEISDQYYTVRWEIIDSSVPAEVTAVSSKLKCYRITETNSTLVEWSAEYSSDVSPSLVLFDKRSFMENLIEMRNRLLGNQIPVLYHVHEAPSTRVIWICRELGVPLDVREVNLQPSLKLSKSTELPISKGGLVTSFLDRDNVLYESGAILTYLLEKHDPYNIFSPKIGSLDRPKYLKYFFHVSSTIDHLLLSSYKKIFVEGTPDHELVNENRHQWDYLALELAKELKSTQFIAGDNFTACDIMLGWALHMAELLDWLKDNQELSRYYQTLSKRAAFKSAFEYQ